MSPRLDTYDDVKSYLYSLRHHGAKYGIDRMRLLAEALGHPERRFPIIHVAGTNGKGSVCAMLEAMFRLSGYKTGLFTSPHLVHQGERVQVNRQILEPALVTAYTRRLVPIAEALAARDPDDHPSFFEFMTAMAFLHFSEVGVQMGVIEVGLGGRLDATNIVEPEISVITSIGFDHMAILGNTLAAIAGEKAGIIKPGKPVVIGRLPPEAEAVIRRRAADLGCRVWSVRETFGEDIQTYPSTNLTGDFQRYNAATALLTTWALESRFSVTQDTALRALREVSWPGRWDLHQVGDKKLILDATHNEEGARYLDGNLTRLRASLGGRRLPIVTGVLGLERAQALFPVLAAHASEIHLLRPHQPRACSFEELEACLPKSFPGPVFRQQLKDLFPFPGHCTLGAAGDTIVVTGSIYLLGEILDALYHAIPVGEGTLQD